MQALRVMQISPILVEHGRERDADCQLGNNTGSSINGFLVPTHSNVFFKELHLHLE